jgi:hypothetical protein
MTKGGWKGWHGERWVRGRERSIMVGFLLRVDAGRTVFCVRWWSGRGVRRATLLMLVRAFIFAQMLGSVYRPIQGGLRSTYVSIKEQKRYLIRYGVHIMLLEKR